MEHPFSVGARVRKLGCHSVDQHAADEVGGADLGGAGEEGLAEVLGGRGGCGGSSGGLCDDESIQKCSHKVSWIRLVSAEACNILLALFLITAIVLQGRHYSEATEVVPASSFIVMLSLASFAISWTRVNPPLSTESQQRRLKRIALDMLIGSALTLISAGLLLISADSQLQNSSLSSALIALHIVFLAAGLIMGWLALSRMLREAARGEIVG